MEASHSGPLQKVLQAVGSLRLGTTILVAMMLALGAATAIESSRGSEQALARMYQSSWFTVLLALLGVNMLAAVAVRWPLQKRQFGFVLTHVSIVVILVGAWTTRHFGVDGQLSIAEGESRDSFASTREMLAVANGDRTASVDLDPPIGGLEPVDHPKVPELVIEPLAARFTVERYLPDSMVEQRVTDDGNSDLGAVQVSISQAGRQKNAWVFEGRSAHVGSVTVAYRSADAGEMIGFLAGERRNDWIAAGRVSIDLDGTLTDIPLADCLKSPAPIGDSGYRVKAINVWTHASVGSDGKLGNVSSLPTNPAIELEVTGKEPEGNDVVDHRLVFAEYPDFDSNPEARHIENMKVTFSCPVVSTSETDIELIRAPDDSIFARCAWEGTPEEFVRIEPGLPMETPWPGRSLTLQRRFTRAKRSEEIVQPETVRPNRVAAMLVRVQKGETSKQVWVRRGVPEPVKLEDRTVQLVYTQKQLPLGFSAKLDHFRISHYPGTRQPRSFESQLTFTDHATGLTEQRLVSMNHPATYGGMTFFQSSYQMDRGLTRSVLSMSRDPGMTVTFVGYLGSFLGMLVVLVNRMREHRHGLHVAPAVVRANRAASISRKGRNAVPHFSKNETNSAARRRREIVEATPEVTR